MFLSDIAIARPVFTLMMSIALIVFGVLSYRSLPVDQYPPVAFPMMIVQTTWPGASPEDIERDVSRPIEDAVASVAGLDQMRSMSRDNVSIVFIQLAMGTNLTDAVSMVRDKVGSVRGKLPSGVDEPMIKQIDIGALPVMVIALSAPGGVNGTRALADDRLRPLLEQVDGVGSVNVIGGQDREIVVNLDLDAMRSVGITANDVAQRIGWENLSLPVGQYDGFGRTIGIRAEGAYKNIDDLKATVVGMTRDGKTVRLDQVADVRDDWSRATRYVRFNRNDAVSLEVIKRSGANTVEVSHQVQAALEKAIPTLGAGVHYDIIADTSRDIEANADEVTTAIVFGGAMAVLVILFFLLDWRGTMISAMALPTSVIGTFAAMSMLGFSINTMTLIALSLAIGLLIDDAVVVREAITHRLEMGDSPAKAASEGTKEIALAVLATTLSLVAVFVPVAFMSGIVGQFFRQFGLTIAVAVLLSLFVAFTLDPMLSSRLSRVRHGKHTGLFGVIERFLDWIDASYRRILDLVLRWRKTTAFIALLTLIATAGIATRVPAEFVPNEDRGEFFADLRIPVGASLDETERMSRRVESVILGIPGVRGVYTIVGHEDQSNRARFRIQLVPKQQRKEPSSRYEDMVRRILETVPSSEVTIAKPGMIEGLGDWPPLMVVVQGDDMQVLHDQAVRVKGLLDAIPGTQDVRLSVTPGRPELHLDIDRPVAADRGIPAGLVASTARMLVEGQIIGSLRDGGRQADIRVRAAPRFSQDRAAIEALPLPSPRGLVSLGEVAHVDMGAGPSEIQRTNRMRSISVWVQVGPGAALGDIVTAFQASIAKAPLPEGFFYTLDGQAKDMNETAGAMGLAVAIAMICIFMVLASQFESLAHPFTLLMSVPLAMVGAILALWVTGNHFSMGSQIGLILLMGLVTKNAILLVDGALQGMRDGLDALEAMRRAGPRRMRPILMTSAAMVFGMIPTAIGRGVGAEFRAPMAIVVIGGVISSTLLTLLVVPIVFLWVEGLSQQGMRLWNWLNPDAVPLDEGHATPAPAPSAESPEAAK